MINQMRDVEEIWRFEQHVQSTPEHTNERGRSHASNNNRKWAHTQKSNKIGSYTQKKKRNYYRFAKVVNLLYWLNEYDEREWVRVYHSRCDGSHKMCGIVSCQSRGRNE